MKIEINKALNDIVYRLGNEFSPDFINFHADLNKDIQNYLISYENLDQINIHLNVMLRLFAVQMAKLLRFLGKEERAKILVLLNVFVLEILEEEKE